MQTTTLPGPAERQVSCQVIGMLFVVCKEKGIDTDAILEGVSYSEDYLCTKSNFIEWDSLVTLANNAARYFSEEDILDISRKTFQHPLFLIYKLIGRLRFNIFQHYMYLMGPDGLVTDFYPIQSELLGYDKAHRKLEIRLSVKDGLKPCKEFLMIIEGQARGIPEALGFRAAKVNASYGERDLTLSIDLPDEKGLFCFLRRVLLYPIDIIRAARNLEQTHKDLLRRNHELEEETRNLRRTQELSNFQGKQLMLLENNFSLVLWSVDMELKNQYMSPSIEQVFGYTVDEALGLPPMALIHEEDKPRAIEMLQTEMERELSGDPYLGTKSLRMRQIKKDGTIVHCENHMSFMRDDNDEISGIVGVMIDIEDEIEKEEHAASMEKQLREAKHLESLGQLAGGIAHDFNNSLQVIMGFTEMAIEENESESVHYLLQEALQSANSTSKLIGELLVLSRRHPIEKEPIYLIEWLNTLLPMTRQILGDKITTAIYSEGEFEILADPVQLKRVIINLLMNAFDAMPNGGNLEIVVESEEPLVNIMVRDNGTGINEEHLENLFEPYFTTKPKRKGGGLGLAVSRGIIDQHDGFISASSTPDKGTTIIIQLPINKIVQGYDSEVPEQKAC